MVVAVSLLLAGSLCACKDDAASSVEEQQPPVSGWSVPSHDDTHEDEPVADGASGTSSGASSTRSEKDNPDYDPANDIEDTSDLPEYIVDDDFVSRKAHDDGIVLPEIRKMFTWSSAGEYKKARDGVASGPLGAHAKPEVLETFMPEEYTSGANMEFIGMDSHVAEIGGASSGDVEYISLIEVQSRGKNNTSSKGKFLAVYTVTMDGTVQDFEVCSLNL